MVWLGIRESPGQKEAAGCTSFDGHKPEKELWILFCLAE
jgi:hypothetical protein